MATAQTIEWPLGRAPKALQHPMVNTLMRGVILRQREVSNAEMTASAVRVTNEVDLTPFHGQDPAPMFKAKVQLGFVLDLAYTASNIVVGATDLGPIKLMNRLLSSIFEEMAERMPLETEIREYLWKLCKQLERAGVNGDKDCRFLFPKAERAFATYDNRLMWVSFAMSVFTDNLLEQMASAGLMPSEAELDEMSAALNKLRMYGVKSCYQKDEILPINTKSAWVFLDGYLFRETQLDAGMEGIVNRVADFYLADFPIRDLRIREARKGGVGDEGVLTFNVAYGRRLSGAILPDGHLEGGIGLSVHPLLKYFKEARVPEAYRVMRALQLMRLFDLTVPVAMVRAMPESAQISTAYGRRPKPQDREFRSIRDLWLPRQHIIRAGAEALVERIKAERIPVEPAGPRARHTVEGFFRPLLPGQTASSEAHAKLQEERPGAVMMEGHTFVKTHKRGSGPEILAHDARKR